MNAAVKESYRSAMEGLEWERSRGIVSEAPPSKRPRVSRDAAPPKTKAVGSRKPPKKKDDDEEEIQGCPECTSGEECIGTPTDDLYRHIDRTAEGEEGGIYCAKCWDTFIQENPELEGELIPHS